VRVALAIALPLAAALLQSAVVPFLSVGDARPNLPFLVAGSWSPDGSAITALEARSNTDVSPLTSRWRYTEKGERMLVQLNRPPHYATIIVKMGMPIRVGEHEIRGAVRAVLVGWVDKPANVGLNAQYIKVVSANFIAPSAHRTFARIQPRPGHVCCRQAFKAAVAIAQIDIVRIRLVPKLIVYAPKFV